MIFIAPPLAGKGTQSEILADYLKIPHLSSGAFLRKRAAENDEFGKKLMLMMENGELVSAEETVKIIEEHLTKNDIENSFILDGFPRNVEQAEAYQKFLSKINVQENIVIVINLSKEQAEARLNGRYTCMQCGETYNYSHLNTSPKVKGICDECGSILEHRNDDNSESLVKRFKVFEEQTKPLINYYQNLGNLMVIVDGSKQKEEISEEIIRYFKENFYD